MRGHYTLKSVHTTQFLIDWRSFRPFLPPVWTKPYCGSIESKVHTVLYTIFVCFKLILSIPPCQAETGLDRQPPNCLCCIRRIVRARWANKSTRKLQLFPRSTHRQRTDVITLTTYSILQPTAFVNDECFSLFPMCCGYGMYG